MTEERIRMTVDETIGKVCRILGDVNATEIWSKDRTYRVATARQLVYWHLFYVHKLGWSEIGRAMNKHHATIMYGARQIDIILERNRTKEDKRIFNAVQELKKQDYEREQDKEI